MIRALIADDHAIFRRGLRQVLETLPDLAVAREAEDGAATLDMIRSEPFDLVILDLSIPGGGGLEILRRLKRQRPALPVIVLSAHSEQQYAARAFRLGASSCLTRGSGCEEFASAIRKALEGGVYVSSQEAESLARGVRLDVPETPHAKLTDREYEVMLRIASGMSSGEIAADLALSVKTIGTYRARILRKLDLRSVVELTRYALKRKLISA